MMVKLTSTYNVLYSVNSDMKLDSVMKFVSDY